MRGKNLVALAFSFVFYAWGQHTFLWVLPASIAFNALAALQIDRLKGRARTAALAATVTVNVAVLAVFKYAGFLAGNLDVVLRPFGLSVPDPHIALPLGISFFTFHCLSYVIDVYRRRFTANPDLSQVALYIMLFPQLVAGPIVRYKTVARQLHARRSTLGRASAGARILVIGLAQKVLIADQVAPLAEVAFDHTPLPSMLDAWTGLLAYTVQIYFDFAGYSNMAIGIGLMLGFTLPRNFRLPYASMSITEFWRRWHMSLSSWLRDYLYIPLGGSRHGKAQTYRNLATVFVLCGLWHGASWNFVLWGLWHGTALMVERLKFAPRLAAGPAALRWAATLLVVMGGWVLFRSHDLPTAAAMYGSLVGRNGIGPMSFAMHSVLSNAAVAALLAGCGLAVLPRWIRLRTVGGPLTAVADTAWTFCVVVVAMIYVAASAYSPFLYFRF